MSKWIKKGDTVIVTSGNSKGKQGEVIARDIDRVLIRGVNVRQKHVRPKSRNEEGRLERKEMPVHISNVRLCDAQGKPVKLRVRMTEGTKELYYRSGEEEVVHRKL